MGSFGLAEWAIIIVILILFFGAKRIPGMARGLAQGYVEFKRAKAPDADEKKEKEDRLNNDQTGSDSSGSTEETRERESV